MPMDVQEAVRVARAGRRAAARFGGTFELDHDKLRAMGMTQAQIGQAESFLARYDALDAELAAHGR
jgi:hypothetical protein